MKRSIERCRGGRRTGKHGRKNRQENKRREHKHGQDRKRCEKTGREQGGKGKKIKSRKTGKATDEGREKQ